MLFVQVTDATNVVHVVNAGQILRVQQADANWQIIFASGHPVLLNDVEAKKLFAILPFALC